MKKRYKITLVLLIILLITAISLGVYKYFFKKNKKDEPKNTTVVVSSIEKYGYTLDDRDSSYMKTTYKEYKINEEEYAKTLAKLFVIDFYTLNNKINKFDVGSLEYIYSEKTDIFKNKAMDTIYNDVIDNTYKDRVQELPEITNVEIISITKNEIELAEQKKDGYKITMKYTYKKDLGYDIEGTIYIINNNDKLEVVKYEPSIKE